MKLRRMNPPSTTTVTSASNVTVTDANASQLTSAAPPPPSRSETRTYERWSSSGSLVDPILIQMFSSRTPPPRQSVPTSSAIGTQSTIPPSEPASSVASPLFSTTAPASRTRKPRTGVIAGATIGAVVAIAIIALLVWLLVFRRRRRRQRILSHSEEDGAFSREKMIKEREPTPNVLQPSAIPSLTVTNARDSLDTNGAAAVASNRLSAVPSRTSSFDDTTTVGDKRDSYLPPPNTGTARTDRQMQIEQKMMELQGQLIALNERSKVPRSQGRSSPEETQMEEIKERIEKLKVLMGGEWAMERSDETPAEILG
ncbi:hypothetical protein V5O48_009092 [Marasmius crinis-equi]|uniref:Uncharacterized protein n=1 Tax=Marasmius crinis-equi TaxID=585013 RepID=A0ABR3FC45_9AGAR